MLTLLSELLLRIGEADGETLRRIWHLEIRVPGWTDDERQILNNAFDARAVTLNAESLGLAKPRWDRAQQQT